MSLPVGSFSWRNRWTYDDDKHRMPFEIGPLPHQVAAREEFEKTMISATTASADPALAVQPQAHHRPTPRVLSQYRHRTPSTARLLPVSVACFRWSCPLPPLCLTLVSPSFNRPS